MRNYHDIGGVTDYGEVKMSDHELMPWEKRADAIGRVLGRKKMLVTDEGRRSIENLGDELYKKLSYNERRLHALANNLLLRGYITVDELNRKIAEVEAKRRQWAKA